MSVDFRLFVVDESHRIVYVVHDLIVDGFKRQRVLEHCWPSVYRFVKKKHVVVR